MEDKGIIAKQLAAIMASAKAIGKDSKNKQQGFNFRGIDAVMNHLHPVFAKHGVFIMPEVLADATEERQTKAGGNLIYRVLRIKFNFVAEDGSSVASVVVGEGMDTGDKAANKAMAVGLKYALTQMLLLPYDEVDPDATVQPASAPVSRAAKRATAEAPAVNNVTGENTIVGYVDGVSTKTGTSKRGDWTRYGVKIDGVFYNTFDTTVGDAASTAADDGRQVSLTFVVNDKGYNDITDLSFVDGTTEPEPPEEEPLPF